MIVASSTPSNPLALTTDLLDRAQVGARLVLSYSTVASVYERVVGGWRSDQQPHDVSSSSILFGWGDTDLSLLSWTLHHPGMVRVTQAVHPVIGRHWGWSCCQCGDGLHYHPSASRAGDDARAHVINHAEMAIA